MMFLLAYWRIGLVAVLIAGAFYWHQRAVTRAYERGATERQEAMLKDEAARIEQARTVMLQELATEKATLDAERMAVESERMALATQRRTITAEFNRSLAALTQRETTIRNDTLSVPDIDLLPRIRDILPILRAADSQRSTR